jgi:hypothetical protein
MEMNHIKKIYIYEINCDHRQAGMGLVGVLMIITIFSMILVSISTYLITNQKMNALFAIKKKTFYLSESGIEFAIKKSIDTNNWEWTQVLDYEGGTITVVVTNVNRDTSRITSTAQMGPYGAEHVQYLTGTGGRSPSDFSVNITGNSLNALGYDDPSRLQFNSTDLPEIDLDSLENIARLQGHYDNNNLTINNSYPSTNFWSDPSDHSKDATIYYIRRDLTITKNNEPFGGIFLVMGDVILDAFFNVQNLYGVIYMADDKRMRVIESSGLFNARILYGGIIGNTNINAGTGFLGNNLSVNYDADIISKFYTYSTNSNESPLQKLSWVMNY